MVSMLLLLVNSTEKWILGIEFASVSHLASRGAAAVEKGHACIVPVHVRSGSNRVWG